MVFTVMAILFIAYGLDLVGRARTLQQQMALQLALVDDLVGVNEGLHQLELVHRVDVHGRQYQWSADIQRLRTRMERIGDRYGEIPGVGQLQQELAIVLDKVDSLHHDAMIGHRPMADIKANEAIMRLLLGRGLKLVDRTSKDIHVHGIGEQAAQLGGHWNEARLLLIAAGLFAVMLAWLAGLNQRLLRQSEQRETELDLARNRLEASHRELRETMLSKEEKEVMIKEIHHRVKNNLQIVKSLIRFQMDQVKEPRTLELFNECVNRVSAMALVHEQTYLSKDLANIEVDTYLQALIRDLAHAYAVGLDLRMDVDIRVRTLSVDALVPLGLLINEVISNSFKHAFKGRDRGTIIVHLSGGEKEGLVLRIGDDGIGLPDRDSWRNPQSLGMELIHTLAGQLDLVLHRADAPGTLYELLPEATQQQRRA